VPGQGAEFGQNIREEGPRAHHRRPARHDDGGIIIFTASRSVACC